MNIMKIIKYIALILFSFTVSATNAQDFNKNTFSVSLGAPVSPLSKSNSITPMGRLGITYFRNLTEGWQVGAKIEWTNWTFKGAKDNDYPIVIETDKNSDLLLAQNTIVPQITTRYNFHFSKFIVSPGIYFGLEIPFNASKEVYVKSANSNDMLHKYIIFSDNKVKPMICGTLKFGYAFSPNFTLAIEGGYNKTFGTITVSEIIYDAYEHILPALKSMYAKKLHSWPIMITADISF